MNHSNIDQHELHKFDQSNSRWWDETGPLKTLHVINPVRLDFIKKQIALEGKKICDVGCGGGILSESLAQEAASVVGIDMNESAIQTAKEHSELNGLSNLEYQAIHSETYANDNPQTFDIVTCLEMLEHVPHPEAIIASCSKLLKPGGILFLSTLNRSLSAYLKAVLAAEYLFNILPKGTHDYSKFIKPSELSQICRHNALEILSIKGLAYIPFIDKAFISSKLDTNYLLCAQKTQPL